MNANEMAEFISNEEVSLRDDIQILMNRISEQTGLLVTEITIPIHITDVSTQDQKSFISSPAIPDIKTSLPGRL